MADKKRTPKVADQVTGLVPSVIEVHLNQLDQTAVKILKLLKAGDILALYGPLAAGKTTVTQAILAAMGYRGVVNSPTFVLERRYPVKWQDIHEVIHLDFYRLEEKDLASLHWQEDTGLPGTLTIIEWPERIKGE